MHVKSVEPVNCSAAVAQMKAGEMAGIRMEAAMDERARAVQRAPADA
jgi:hypothetical protein